MLIRFTYAWIQRHLTEPQGTFMAGRTKKFCQEKMSTFIFWTRNIHKNVQIKMATFRATIKNSIIGGRAAPYKSSVILTKLFHTKIQKYARDEFQVLKK